ncbi:MAG: hypothetical protein NVS3B14_17330 [Ktedonobacteraceae bacterium]
MSQTSNTTSPNQGEGHRSSLGFVSVGLFFGILLCVAVIAGTFGILSAIGGQGTAQTAQAAQAERHVRVNLSIMINQPGMQKDWPAYAPTRLVVPANSLVTISVRNYDLGDTPLPGNSPFSSVQGTVSGMASADGKLYSSLAPGKVAHTFTISQLNINVPLPGDAPQGASYATVTFTIHTGKAGTYIFQCFDPCGTGPMGWMGPMVTKGYMMGTLIVQ